MSMSENIVGIWITGLWAVFLLTHSGLSSVRLRPKLVALFGPRGFLAFYSLISFAVFIPLVWLYAANRHAGTFLWYGSAVSGMRWLVYPGLALSIVLMVGAFLNPSPTSIAPGSGEVNGVLRVTRHPLFMGASGLGLLHLLVVRVHVSDLAFFLGLPIVGILGCWHQDHRKRISDGPAIESFLEQTAFFPFARGGAIGLIRPPLALLIGVAVTFVLRWFHPQLFGGA